MITFRDDGSIEIDFPDRDIPVVVKPPKWGTYVALRREDADLAETFTAKINDLTDLGALPAPDDTSDAAVAERKRLTPLFQERARLVQDWAADSLGRRWQLILLGKEGDQKLPGLATPRPPDDQDEWPAELFVDAGDLETDATGTVVRVNPRLLDLVWRHWGKARSVLGATGMPPAL